MNWIEEKQKLSREIVELLYKYNMIDTWYKSKSEGWTLFSDLWSPIYINLRLVGGYPNVLKKIGHALARLIEEECKDASLIVGIASAGVPIATAISVEGGIPMAYTRKLEGVKNLNDFQEKLSSYGQHNLVEGNIRDSENIILIDDLVTSLGSKLIAREQVLFEASRRNVTITCDNIVVILDREQGAEKLAKEKGLSLFSLIRFTSDGIHWLKDKFSDVEYEVISDYLNNTDKYQDKKIQSEVKKMCQAR
ncbi:MAG: orotate phosphoribosyltransferase [Promethearchaeota archaeon]